jgi:hypothetical protein
MELKLFTDLIDGLRKATDGPKALINLPTAEQEAMHHRTLNETYRPIDTTLNMVVIRMGDILMLPPTTISWVRPLGLKALLSVCRRSVRSDCAIGEDRSHDRTQPFLLYLYVSFTNTPLPLLNVAALYFDKLYIFDRVGASGATIGANHQAQEAVMRSSLGRGHLADGDACEWPGGVRRSDLRRHPPRQAIPGIRGSMAHVMTERLRSTK